MQAKYPIKLQVVRAKHQPLRFHVNIPLPLAAAIGLEGGELMQWELLDRGELHLTRLAVPPPQARRRAART